MDIVVHPLRWFFCFLGCGSFHFVPCIPPFCWVLWFCFMIGRVSSFGGFPKMHASDSDPRFPQCAAKKTKAGLSLPRYFFVPTFLLYNYINSLQCLTFSLLRNILQNSSPSESHGTCSMLLVLGPKS